MKSKKKTKTYSKTDLLKQSTEKNDSQKTQKHTQQDDSKK